MTEDLIVHIKPPRIEHAGDFVVAGVSEWFSFDTNHGIPQLWQRFSSLMANIPGQVGSVTYGVCCNSDSEGSFEYIAGIEVTCTATLPADFNHLHIPAAKYLVFSHEDHISSLRNTVYTIWHKFLPDSPYAAARKPDFERYDQRFDPRTGTGIVEIWVPIS